MQDRIDALLAAGAQNLWPKFVLFKPRTPDTKAEHVVVAEVKDGVCVLTDEGHALLKQKPDVVDAEVVSERKKPASRKKKDEVAVEAEPDLDDLDLLE